MKMRVSFNTERAFTLIEILLVMVLISLLAGLSAPVVKNAITRANETALLHNLSVTRKAIDDYYSDKGHYPESLEQLVDENYIKKMPYDPLAGSDTDWILIEPENADLSGVADLKSSSERKALNGSYVNEW